MSVGHGTRDLHGLGRGRTLALVNGRRLSAEASFGGTNVNNIRWLWCASTKQGHAERLLAVFVKFVKH